MTIPLNVISGFLGSGKTTLLNRLLTNPKMESTLVLISDSNRFTTVYRYLRTFVNPGAFPSGVPFTFNPFDDLYFKQYYTFAGAVIADLSFTDIGQPGTFAEISLRTDPANPPDTVATRRPTPKCSRCGPRRRRSVARASTAQPSSPRSNRVRCVRVRP